MFVEFLLVFQFLYCRYAGFENRVKTYVPPWKKWIEWITLVTHDTESNVFNSGFQISSLYSKYCSKSLGLSLVSL